MITLALTSMIRCYGKMVQHTKSVMQHFNDIDSHLCIEVARKLSLCHHFIAFCTTLHHFLHSQCQGFCIVSKLFLMFTFFCSVTLLSIASTSFFHLFTFAFSLLQFASFALCIYVMCTPFLLYCITIAINYTFSSQLSCLYCLIVTMSFDILFFLQCYYNWIKTYCISMSTLNWWMQPRFIKLL
jgi:hypothetical protein